MRKMSQMSRLDDVLSAELGFPVVKRCCRDPVAPAKIACLRARLTLPQYSDNLLSREP